MDFLGFLAGQLMATLVFWALWKDDTKSWSAYWKNGHLPQHIVDLCLSVFAFVAWQTGLLVTLADVVGVGELVAKLPNSQTGMAVTFLMGGVFAFLTWKFMGHKAPKE